jgi:LmbE family N-acetylglucosaminyl deacetylase
MGIEPPVFLSIDRLDTKIGVRNYFNAHKQLLDSLIQRIATINPDIIITFGPDGDSHHAEHIVVGSAVTEFSLQKVGSRDILYIILRIINTMVN